MNRYGKFEKKEAFQIIMNFTNMNRQGFNNPTQQAIEDRSSVNSTARIKKNFSFSSSKNKHDPNTISIDRSLQRENTGTGSDVNTEGLLDYPAGFSAQSSNKLKHKKSLPLESQVSNVSSTHSSMAKPDKIEQIYGMRNSKAKRPIPNSKASSLKSGEHGVDLTKQNIAKASFEDYLRKKTNQDVSLPYIQASHSANAPAGNLGPPNGAKWSPSKRKDKKVVAEHAIMKGSLNQKGKRGKFDVGKVANTGKNSHKFVAIYSNSNS